MDIIKRAMLLDGNAVVTVIDMSETVKHAEKVHKLSAMSAELLGQALIMTEYLGMGFKNKTDSLSVIIDGGGAAGKIITCFEGGKVKGFIQNPQLDGDNTDKFARALAVGKNGTITVTTDYGLKQPFVTKTPLITGDLSLDFAFFLLQSEQKRAAVNLTANTKKSCGGIVIEPMAMCSEDTLVMLEDSAEIFADFAEILSEREPEEIIGYYFHHFAPDAMSDLFPEWGCSCSRKKTDAVIASLGRAEAEKYIKEDGCIEVRCDFCDTTQTYKTEDLAALFD